MKRTCEIDIVGVGEDEEAPEAVAKLVTKARVKLRGGAKAVFRHQQFHQVADVANETLG
jgi:hypothetical protein